MPENNIDELKYQATTGQYAPHGAAKDADCVIAFSFGLEGQGESAKPGKGNEQIAEFAYKHFGKLPKLFQWEVADAYPDDGTVQLRVARHRKEGEYLHTYEVAEQFKTYMTQKGLKRAVLIAHPHHVPRCDAVCRKLEIDTVVPVGLEVIPFDSNSSQEWTRSKAAWAEREPASIDHSKERNWL